MNKTVADPAARFVVARALDAGEQLGLSPSELELGTLTVLGFARPLAELSLASGPVELSGARAREPLPIARSVRVYTNEALVPIEPPAWLANVGLPRVDPCQRFLARTVVLGERAGDVFGLVPLGGGRFFVSVDLEGSDNFAFYIVDRSSVVELLLPAEVHASTMAATSDGSIWAIERAVLHELIPREPTWLVVPHPLRTAGSTTTITEQYVTYMAAWPRVGRQRRLVFVTNEGLVLSFDGQSFSELGPADGITDPERDLLVIDADDLIATTSLRSTFRRFRRGVESEESAPISVEGYTGVGRSVGLGPILAAEPFDNDTIFLFTRDGTRWEEIPQDNAAEAGDVNKINGVIEDGDGFIAVGNDGVVVQYTRQRADYYSREPIHGLCPTQLAGSGRFFFVYRIDADTLIVAGHQHGSSHDNPASITLLER